MGCGVCGEGRGHFCNQHPHPRVKQVQQAVVSERVVRAARGKVSGQHRPPAAHPRRAPRMGLDGEFEKKKEKKSTLSIVTATVPRVKGIATESNKVDPALAYV